METFAIFAASITMLLLGFVVIMLAIACFCFVVRKIGRKKEISPRLEKWIYILDWTKEDK